MIDLRPDHLAIIRDVLQRYAPDDEVRAFGSRVRWTAKDASDLDLVVMTTKPLEISRLADLEQALSESDLPFRVDVLDWHAISPDFQRIIAEGYEVIQAAGGSQVMAGEWTEYTVAEFADIIGGGTPSTADEEKFGGDIPWITPKDLSGHKFRRIERGERNITEKGLNSSNATLLPTGAVLLSSRAPVGYLAIAANPVTTNQGFKSLIVHSEFDNEFVYYLLKANVEYLKSQASGTTFGELSGETLKKLKFTLPPLPEQRAIARILGALDDKIELNRRMNETLEAMARAVFREMMNASREGAKEKTIGDVVEVVGGSTPSTSNPAFWNGGNIHWATPKDLAPLQSPILLDTNSQITELGLREISSSLLPVGTVLLSSRAPIGYLAIAQIPVAINQGFIAIKCTEEAPNYFMLNWLRENMEAIEGRANGTTFLEISKSNFRPMKITVPPSEKMKAFVEQVEPLYQKIVANLKESRTLASLRDGLLPKLMQGEVMVKNLKGLGKENA